MTNMSSNYFLIIDLLIIKSVESEL